MQVASPPVEEVEEQMEIGQSRRMMSLSSVLLVLGLVVVIGFVFVRGTGPCLSKPEITKIKLNQYAEEAFPSWSTNHPGKACPDKLVDLNEYMSSNDTNDAWGRPIKLLCPPPVGVERIGVTSRGEDGKEGTPDDLKSWE
jgi:hypothetical protein